MTISVTDPFSPAIERVKDVLFRPIEAGKWICLAFCAWLAQFGQGGGLDFNFNFSGRTGRGGPNPFLKMYDEALKWINANWDFFLIAAAGTFLLGVVFSLLFMWLSSRAQFMFIDGIAKNRGAVREPWGEYRAEGNSLFLFRLAWSIIFFLAILAVAAPSAYLAWPEIRSRNFGSDFTQAFILLAVLMVPILLAGVVVNMFLMDFVVPTMYKRRVRVMEAWRIVRTELLAGRIGTFVLYALFAVVLKVGVGICGFVLTLVTCCIIAIVPFIGTVVLLPLITFMRAYTLCFLEQFGPQWEFFAPDEDDSLGEEQFA